MCRPKKYLTEEERKAARKQYYQDNKEHFKEYYQDNKDEKLEYQKQYREDNKEYIKEYKKEYRQTPTGRASHLIDRYKQSDKEQNRGECTLTPKWIIENIFSKPCHYCGKEGWDVIGCDRIDNSKPHTPDNVVPCCYECNCKRGRRDYEEFVLDIMLI